MSKETFTLYELTVEGQELERLLLESEGELSEGLEKRFDAILTAGKDKIAAAAHVVRNLEAEAAKQRAIAQAYWDLAAAKEKEVTFLKERLALAVVSCFPKSEPSPSGTIEGSVKTWAGTVYTQTSQGGMEVTMAPDADITQLEPLGLVKVERTLKKTEIKKYLEENGDDSLPEVVVEKLPGKRSLRIR